MRRVAITFFEVGVEKKIHAKILIARHFMIIFLFKKISLISTVSNINRIAYVMYI